MSTDVPVVCPSAESVARTGFIGDDLSRSIGDLEAGETWVDLERRLARVLIGVRPAGSSLPYERFATRPSSEQVLPANWSVLREALSNDLADCLVAGLTGAPARSRGVIAMSVASRSGRRTIFAPMSIASDWALRVNRAEIVVRDPFKLACHAYAEVALSHPYADGNGRLARAMFHRAFARAGLLDAPLLPLGPLIYLNHKPVIAALVRLGTTGDWTPFLHIMAGLTQKAVAFTEHELHSQAPTIRRDAGPS